jgi:hypothetical protein
MFPFVVYFGETMSTGTIYLESFGKVKTNLVFSTLILWASLLYSYFKRRK